MGEGKREKKTSSGPGRVVEAAARAASVVGRSLKRAAGDVRRTGIKTQAKAAGIQAKRLLGRIAARFRR